MLSSKPPRKKSVTLRDVALKAGVSPKTVSNFINHWPHMTGETRQKVQQAIDALGYRPSAIASSLRTGRTNTVGLVVPDVTNPFFGQVVRGCEDVLYAAGYSIFLCNTGEDPTRELRYLEMLSSRGVDGLLLFGMRCSSEEPSGLVHDITPVVAEDSIALHANTSLIDIDNAGGARMAVEHLIGLGHERIAHLGGPENRLSAERRLDGYRQAMAEAGLPTAGMVYRCAPTIRGGYGAALDVLRRQHPTALFCYNDLMAAGAIIACRQEQLEVPGDVAVAGFDDIAISSFIEPSLTTVRVRQYDLGRAAAEMLLDRLAGKEAVSQPLLFPVELVVRYSCGARRLSREQPAAMLENLLQSDLANLGECGPESRQPLD